MVMAQQTTEISDSLAPVLSYCEQQRFTGRLEVQTREGTAQIMLLSGIVESSSLGAETGDEVMSQLSTLPIEALTSEAQLPPVNARTTRGLLPRGALGMLRPVELMRFCEKNALTCTLSIQAAGTSLRIEYERGELTELTPESAMTPAVLEACDGQYKFDLPQLSTLNQFVSKEKGGTAAPTGAQGNRATAGNLANPIPRTTSKSSMAAKAPSPVRPVPNAGAGGAAQRPPGARRMAPEAMRLQPPRSPVVVKQPVDGSPLGAPSGSIPLPTRSSSQPPAARASTAVNRPASASKKTAALGSMAVAPTAAALPQSTNAGATSASDSPTLTARQGVVDPTTPRPQARPQAPVVVSSATAASPVALQPAAKPSAPETLGAAPSLTVEPVQSRADAPGPFGSPAPSANPTDLPQLEPRGSATSLETPELSPEQPTHDSPKRLYPRIYLAFVLLLAAAGWTMWKMFR